MARPRLHVGGIEAERIAAFGLGLVHRQVGVLQEVLGIGAVGGMHGDSDARRHRDAAALETGEALHDFGDAAREFGRVVAARDAGLQDGEFVAAEPGKDIGLAHLDL